MNKTTAFLAAFTFWGSMGGVLPPVSPVAYAAAPVPGESVATDKIKDLTATLVVVETDRDELRKIGGSFATTYTLKRMSVTYQNPNKARFEAKILGASVLMVYNGNQRMWHIPGKSETKDITGQPGQKQTLMDLGIFAKDYLTTDYEPLYQRTENGLYVYKLAQRNTDNKTHEIVWVNPKNSLIEKRVSYNGDNKLMKELRFTNARQIRPGIWVPQRIEIYNQYGKLGAAQSLEDIKVNLGVDSHQFDVS